LACYVLVHGAFHGGWCWRRVADRLRAAGHRVWAPTLTGLGERAHHLGTAVDLETHVRDLCSLIETEELEHVVLVAHSYGAIPASAAADRMPGRIARMVCVDGVVLEHGASWSSIHAPEIVERFVAGAQERHAGIAIPVPDARSFGVTEAADLAWLNRRLTPHPLGTYRQPVALQRPAGRHERWAPPLYVDCALRPLPTLAVIKDRIRRDAHWESASIPACHDAMIAAPDALASLLVAAGADLAAAPARVVAGHRLPT